MNQKKSSCETCENKDSSIFCRLTNDELKQVDTQKIFTLYKKGQTLFHEGNPPFGIFCINEGKLKLSKSSNDGKESIIKILGPGDVVGHRSIFSNSPYKSTATAIEDVKVCFIDKKYVLELVKQKPELAIEIITHLSKQMGMVETKVAQFYQKNVRERLAIVMLEFKEKYGVQEKDRVRLDIKLTREELASYIGVAPETLIRFMSEFKEEGAIAQDGKILYITNENLLKELGNINE